VLACIGLAIYETVRLRDPSFELQKINVRLQNVTPLTPLKELKSNLVEKFIGVKGNVVRVTSVRPLVVALTFECRKCGARIPKCFPDGRYEAPTGCSNTGCKTRLFEPDRSSARTIDFQTIRLQEVMGTDAADAGRIPRSVECELTDDLVDSCVPGDTVTIVGIVKAFKADSATSTNKSRDKNKSLFLLYLDVKSVQSSTREASGPVSASGPSASDLQQFSTKDLEGIAAIASDANLFRTIVHSLCPAIYGHDMVKAGLCLALFGGVQKNIGDRGKLLIRGDPHVLVVGDPGLGKSQMLRALSTVAPRSVYVCGTSSTTSGLTVSMVRDGYVICQLHKYSN
jgi:DNA helicase MCM8